MTERLRTFTPTEAFRHVPFKVVCEDRWDPHWPQTTIKLDASGPRDAINRVRLEYPDLRPLRAVPA